MFNLLKIVFWIILLENSHISSLYGFSLKGIDFMKKSRPGIARWGRPTYTLYNVYSNGCYLT